MNESGGRGRKEIVEERGKIQRVNKKIEEGEVRKVMKRMI